MAEAAASGLWASPAVEDASPVDPLSLPIMGREKKKIRNRKRERRNDYHVSSSTLDILFNIKSGPDPDGPSLLFYIIATSLSRRRKRRPFLRGIGDRRHTVRRPTEKRSIAKARPRREKGGRLDAEKDGIKARERERETRRNVLYKLWLGRPYQLVRSIQIENVGTFSLSVADRKRHHHTWRVPNSINF